MKTDLLKKQLNKEADRITPPISDKILAEPITASSVEIKAPNPRKYGVLAAISAIVMILLIGVTFAFRFFATDPTAYSCYILEINPSLQLVTDSNDLVTQVNALNEEADVLITTDELSNLVGKSLNECIELIMIQSEKSGYFETENGKPKPIRLFAINGDKKFAKKNLMECGEKMDSFAEEKRFNVKIETDVLGIDDYKNKVGIEGDFKKFEDMKDNIFGMPKFSSDRQDKPLPPQ